MRGGGRHARAELRRSLRDDSGVSAVEFALISPLLLLLVCGVTSMTEAVSARRKVILAANAVSDLVAQERSVDGAYLGNVFAAASAMVFPFDGARLSIVISSIMIDTKGKATVAWSRSSNAVARTKNTVFPIPPDLANQTSLVVAEVTFPFVPTIGYEVIGDFTFSETTFSRPRPLSASTAGVACTAPGC